MIFRRKNAPLSPASAASPAASDSASEPLEPVEPLAAEETLEPFAEDELQDEWLELDLSRDWREDGPFDIEEVDLDADEVNRVDLGALIVTPQPGLKIQLAVDAKAKTATTLIVAAAADALLQLRVLAAPASRGYTAEVRATLEEEATAAGGTSTLAEGPFGTELRRIVKVAAPDGSTGSAPLRDWLVEGPRWLLHAQLGGRAALDVNAQGPAAELEEFFRNLVVRRGAEAIVPGNPVSLRPPGQP